MPLFPCHPLAVLPFSIGFEIEFENADLAPGLRRRACYAGTRFTGLPAGWRLKTDASCGPEGVRNAKGFEAVSPPFFTEGDLNAGVTQVAEFLKSLNPVFNSRCGLHFHLGILNDLVTPARTRYPKANLRRMLMFLIRYEMAFYALCPAHRGENAYCAPIRDHIIAAINGGKGIDAWRVGSAMGPRGNNRFHWLNGHAFDKHGTLEFRMPEATVEMSDLLGWSDFLLHVCDNLVRRNPNPKTPVVAGKSQSQHVAFLLHELLLKTNAYGKNAGTSVAVDRAQRARYWVFDRFKRLHGFSPRTALNRMSREKKSE